MNSSPFAKEGEVNVYSDRAFVMCDAAVGRQIPCTHSSFCLLSFHWQRVYLGLVDPLKGVSEGGLSGLDDRISRSTFKIFGPWTPESANFDRRFEICSTNHA